MKQTLLRAEHISKKFQSKIVLKDISIELKVGEFLTFLGPSGCGKSTLLRILAGLEAVDGGSVQWQGNPQFGFVFQESELLSWRNVLENVRLPLELRAELSVAEQNATALASLAKVGLAESARLFPHELSGGMKMRVSIARALVANPKVLFMDEPFSALDEVTRFQQQDLLRGLCESEFLTVLFVTHSSSEAAYLSDRILMMSNQAGKFILDQPLPFQDRNEIFRKGATYQKQVSEISDKLKGAFA
ncbi:MAG: ABC transporter ATP-binding protein [Bdellovibrionaceae bacterium]|nr:ABC transporter ATP-binding protein [Pseudobdellovibrionaceae bacterium]